MSAIGAIFGAIGSIANVFSSGANERASRTNSLINEKALNSSEEIAQIQLVAALENEKFKMQALIVISLVVLFILIIYLKR